MLTVLIPASGFGKRNPEGQPVKELALHQGVPLLEYSLRHLSETPETIEKVVLITREIKRPAFEAWMSSKDFPFSLEVFIHDPQGREEWPKTLLAAEKLWGQKNWILLPDSEILLKGKKLSYDVEESLSSAETWWGWIPKRGAEAQTFGVISMIGLGVQIQEKPQTLETHGTFQVWGSFGFRKTVGTQLLEGLEWSTQTHQPFLLRSSAALTELSVFFDHSRRD